jgi:large subunit ribosomal protein L25
MAKHSLSAKNRTIVGRAVKHLRKSGEIPANVFGKNLKSVLVQINSKEFSKLHSQVGESTLVYLEVENEKDPRPVLIREVVLHPVSGSILHISFNQVDLKEKVTAPVSVELVGEAPAETSHLGILVQQLNEIEVEALPTDMPERIELDVSGLADVGASIIVGDIKISKNVTLLTPADTLVVKIEPLAKEEVVAAPVPAEGEVPVEGAAPAVGEAAPGAPAEPAKPEEPKK